MGGFVEHAITLALMAICTLLLGCFVSWRLDVVSSSITSEVENVEAKMQDFKRDYGRTLSFNDESIDRLIHSYEEFSEYKANN